MIFKILICFFALSAALNSEVLNNKKFAEFVVKYKKVYQTSEEFDHRYNVFKKNLENAEALSKLNPDAIFGITKFMDITPEEFKAQYLISNFTSQKKMNQNVPILPKASLAKGVNLPPAFNWVSKGATTPIYNQGQCGSCWAFSVTENIESMWAIAGHGLGSLSMQQLVDCSDAYGNEGCGGGNPPWTYPYIINVGGMDSYGSYPYTAENGNCAFSSGNIAASISSWGYVVTKYDEEAMRSWMFQYGPPSICVDAETWQYYQGGIIGPGCGQVIDHCVQLVGWDVISGTPAWIVRNSWGTDWGYSGYLYVNRGADYCAIGDEVTSSVI